MTKARIIKRSLAHFCFIIVWIGLNSLSTFKRIIQNHTIWQCIFQFLTSTKTLPNAKWSSYLIRYQNHELLLTTMWVTTSQTFLPNPIPITHSISFSKLLQPPSTTLSTVRSRRFSVSAAGTNEEVSGLGLAILGSIKSGPSKKLNPNPAQQQDEKPKKGRRKEEVDTGKEVSGSDILRALQRANAKKLSIKKQQQQRVKNIGSGNLKKENDGKKKVVDYDKIRPITVKSDWVTRLDDLEKRLEEFLTL